MTQRCVPICWTTSTRLRDSIMACSKILMPRSNYDTSRIYFLDVFDSSRHPFTGGVRPKKRATAEQQRGELLKSNVNRVLHAMLHAGVTRRVIHLGQMYCQIKEEFPPMDSFIQRLEEQYVQCERVKRHNEELERQTN